MNKKEIKKLSDQLQEALLANNKKLVFNAMDAIAEVSNKAKRAKEKQQQDQEQAEHEAECLRSAEKHPCVVCGGKLAIQKAFLNGSYRETIYFKCENCNEECIRDSADFEDEIQQELQKRIKEFKHSIKELLKTAVSVGLPVKYDENLTEINGKKFKVSARFPDYPTNLSFRYDGRGQNESAGSGKGWWASNLKSVLDVVGDSLFGYKNEQIVKDELNKISRKEEAAKQPPIKDIYAGILPESVKRKKKK
jgi:hypothetical protein